MKGKRERKVTWHTFCGCLTDSCAAHKHPGPCVKSVDVYESD